MNRSSEFQILPSFYIYLSVVLFLLPFPWLFAALLAGLVHELGHIIAIRVMRISISQITLKGAGAKICTGPMSIKQELLCAAAGPIAGILLLVVFPFFPKLSLCGLLQSIFNLLPIGMLDGERILRGSTYLLLGEKWGEIVFCVIKWSVVAAIAGGCIALIWISASAATIPALCILFFAQKYRNTKFRRVKLR